SLQSAQAPGNWQSFSPQMAPCNWLVVVPVTADSKIEDSPTRPPNTPSQHEPRSKILANQQRKPHRRSPVPRSPVPRSPIAITHRDHPSRSPIAITHRDHQARANTYNEIVPRKIAIGEIARADFSTCVRCHREPGDRIGGDAIDEDQLDAEEQLDAMG